MNKNLCHLSFKLLVILSLLYFVAHKFSKHVSTDINLSNETQFLPEYNSTLHLYTVRGKPVVWVFWDYQKMPPYIELSLETFRCHSTGTAHLMIVDDKFLKSQVSNIPESFNWLSPNHKADFFRFSILRKYGGMYLDADTIQLRPVDHLFAQLVDYDIVGYSDATSNAVVGVTSIGPIRANLELLDFWNRDAVKMLTEKHQKLLNFHKTEKEYPLSWGEMNSHWNSNLDPLIKENKVKIKTVVGPTTYGQITADSELLSHLFQPLTKAISRVKSKFLKLNLTVEYLFYHNTVAPKSVKHMPMQNFLSIRSLFLRLIKSSINNCAAYGKKMFKSENFDTLMSLQ